MKPCIYSGRLSKLQKKYTSLHLSSRSADSRAAEKKIENWGWFRWDHEVPNLAARYDVIVFVIDWNESRQEKMIVVEPAGTMKEEKVFIITLVFSWI